MGKERFELLGVMRGIAAMAVVIGHVNGVLGDQRYTASTGLAVDFFFCLSGFVVAHAYGERLQLGALSFWKFVTKRVVRLYPMILAGAALGFAANAYVYQTVRWPDLVLSVLALPRVDGALAFPLNVPMWSLPYELAASIVFGMFVRVSPRVVVGSLVASGLALLVCVLLADRVISFGAGSAAGLAKGALRIAYPFLLGVVLCQVRDRLPRLPSLVAPAALVVLLAAAPPWTGVYQAFAVIVGLPLVLVAGVKAPVPGGLAIVERLSYPLYLVHWPVMLVMCQLLRGRLPPLALGCVVVASATLAAWLVLALYDEPARAWLARRLDGRRAPVPLEAQPVLQDG
jgi:peptidoglycan/LPS O-acetylase OafA/YrhL